MKRQLRGTVAFAVCGSFCTLGAAVAQAEQLVRQGWELLPVMSYAASGLNTRFGRADEWKARLETLTGHRVLDTLQDVEPLGPRQLARALVVAPCTGTTLARLAAGLSDTPVTLAAKSLLRVGCPVLLAVSTNDGLGASGENIARLMQRKHYYFVPYGQDDAAQKPQSLKADLTLLPAALEAAQPETLRALVLGYLAEYLCAAGAHFAQADALDALRAMSYPEAHTALRAVKGVGPKVADCICLFGLHHVDAFPVDTHVKQILSAHYPKGFPFRRYAGCAGILQQYMFYYDLHGSAQAAP